MTVEFQDWSNEYTFNAQSMGSAITTLCSAVRDLRTASVRKSRSAQAQSGSSVQGNACDQLDALSLTLSGGLDELQSGGLASSTLPKRLELPPETALIRGKISDLLDAIAKIRHDFPALSASGESVTPTTAIRKPGLLQKGAKQFAALAEIFQLQDRFDQRNEHILAGFAAALNVGDSSRAAMFQLVNAQVDGVASMTFDYLQSAEQSANSLVSMETVAAEEELETIRQSSEILKPVQLEILKPVVELVELCDSTISDFQAIHTGTTSDELGAEGSNGSASLDSDINKVSDFAESLRVWHANLRSGSDGASEESEGASLLEHLSRVGEKISVLRARVTDLQSLSSDQFGSWDSTIDVGPDLSAVIADITSSFTMDSERDDHRAAMHRLGLAKHSG